MNPLSKNLEKLKAQLSKERKANEVFARSMEVLLKTKDNTISELREVERAAQVKEAALTETVARLRESEETSVEDRH